MDFSNFRVRYKNGDALLQLTQSDMPLFLKNEEWVISTLKKYYSAVFLDKNVRISNE